MSLNFLPFICTVKKYPFMRFLKSLLTAVLVLFTMLYTQAQVTTSSMSGVVKANDGKFLEDASVVATHTPTGTVYRTKTRKGGRFDIFNMNTGGPYTVVVSYVGYGTDTKTDIYLQLGEAEKVDVEMLDAKAELATVVVTGTSVRGSKTGPSSNFGNRVINALPNISRSITNITSFTPQAGGGNSFGGRDGRYNNISIDGANFNNSFGLSNNPLPGGEIAPISIDAFEEIAVSISPFDVKQGNFTGANVQAITRKGSNLFNGSVYGYYRNEGLLGRVTAGKRVPVVDKSETKIFGFRLGGPIIKNKLFFFINYESEDRNAPGVTFIASRPGVPSTSNTSRTTAGALDSVRSFVKTAYGYETGEYENYGNFITKGYKMLGKIDWNIAEGHSLSLRYNYSTGDNDFPVNAASSFTGAGASGRNSRNALSYQNSNYRSTTEVSSYTFDLKSKFGTNISNQLLVTYSTKIDPRRNVPSSFFPFIDIQDGATSPDNYISLGYELFSYKNQVDDKTLTINDNFTYTAGAHNIGAGFEYNRIKVANSFLRYGTSYWRFKNYNDFINDAAPIALAYTYPYAGKEAISDLDFGQLALYLQDEIKFNSRFKMTFGVRVDRPIYNTQPSENPAITALTFRDLSGNPLKLNTGSWPNPQWLINPRVGFNWDVNGDKNLIVRGGAGMFSGRFPFVWFTNQPTNSGVIQNTVQLNAPAFSPLIKFSNYYKDPSKLLTDYPTLFPSQPGTSAPGSIAVVSPDFKMPQVFRLSLGIDKKIADNTFLNFELIYNKDINALVQYNANQAAPTLTPWNGSDNRPRWSTTLANRRINPNVSEAIVLTNTDKGQSFVFTAQITKRFSKNWDAMFAYTFTHSMDITGNPGQQAASVWNSNNSIRGQNDLDYAISTYSTPHRFVGYVNYRFEYLKHLATTITLSYQASNGGGSSSTGRYTYVYSNDANGDGNGGDIMYIPKDRNDIIFVPSAQFTAQQQADAYWDFVAQDEYLSDHLGQYAERNGALLPFVHTLDLRVLQDIFTNIGKHRHSLQISLDVENFGNMLNSDWGVLKRLVQSSSFGSPLLQQVGVDAVSGRPTFNFRAISGVLPTSTFESVNSVSQTWRAQIGLRYTF
jgi:hypothetical protein